MSTEKIEFDTLIKDNKIFYTDNYIDVQADNDAWFENIIFSKCFSLSNMGINYENHNITTLTSKDNSKSTYIFNFYEIATPSNIKTLIFSDCTFKKEPIIRTEGIKSIQFYNCKFDGDIYNLLILKSSIENLDIIFNNCTILRITINPIGKKKYELNTFQINEGSIEHLEIFNTTFENELYINKQYNKNKNITKINELIIKNSTFKENFKLHNCEVQQVYIEDVDYEKHADFYMSNFKKGLEYNKIDDTEKEDLNIYFKAINFKGLAIFGDCTFQEKLTFEWVTFESFSHFRRTRFYKGLDLDYTNIEEEMNFFSVQKLDTEISKKNTSQETYRIIKHNFEKIENKIEANKYHALELEKKLKDKDTTKSEKIILWLNWAISNNGTNWIRPLILIFLIGMATTFSIHWGQEFSCENILKGLSESFKHIYILYKDNDLWSQHPIILALNKFSLGYLYYQFLISVRKDTRK